MKKTKTISGTVTWVNIGGGFFGIVGDDGREYYPENGLPGKTKEEGIRIKADIRFTKGVNIHMWGEAVEVSDVEILN